MPIQYLRVTNLGPFEDIAFEYDAHLNVLVGPNSSGKSTVLATLANLIAYPFALPERLRHRQPATFTLRFLGRDGLTYELSESLPVQQQAPEQQARWVSLLTALGYSAFVPALRQSTGLRTQGTTPPALSAEILTLPDELRLRQSLLPTDATVLRDEAMLATMVDFAQRAAQRNDPAMRRLLMQISAIASEILAGFPVEFWGIAEDRDGLFPQFKTIDGQVAFHIFSQGTQSVLQWLAYVLISYARYYGYPANLTEQPGTVIIDEIDAHLHPIAQQRLLPALQRHFPRLQIFCSTHSPLMLANLQPGQIHLLQRDSQGTVSVSRNDTAVVGYSTDALLQRFFGVPTSQTV